MLLDPAALPCAAAGPFAVDGRWGMTPRYRAASAVLGMGSQTRRSNRREGDARDARQKIKEKIRSPTASGIHMSGERGRGIEKGDLLQH